MQAFPKSCISAARKVVFANLTQRKYAAGSWLDRDPVRAWIHPATQDYDEMAAGPEVLGGTKLRSCRKKKSSMTKHLLNNIW